MIPTEYRLERVVAVLIERLDGARRSFDTPEEARAGFERIAREQVDAAAAEWKELAWDAQSEAHAAFLRAEVLQTFLPRFTKAAVGVNEAEEAQYGLGWWGTPTARILLALVPLLAITIEMRLMLPMGWPIVFATLALPFMADIARTLQMRSYRNTLEEIVADMARIQRQQLTWDPPSDERDTPPSQQDAPTRRLPPRQPEGH